MEKQIPFEDLEARLGRQQATEYLREQNRPISEEQSEIELVAELGE